MHKNIEPSLPNNYEMRDLPYNPAAAVVVGTPLNVPRKC